MRDKILVFVPGYNVGKTISRVLESLDSVRKNVRFDVLYVDNNSSDDSIAIASGKREKYITIIKNKKNLGYGGSQKVAFRYALEKNYKYLIEYAGDMQYPAQKIPELIKKAKEGNSIVFGTRVSSHEDNKDMPRWKYMGNKFTDRIINWGLGINVSEIHTGFRIYNLEKLSRLNLDNCHNDYRWTIDSVAEAVKIDKKFSEVPVKGLYHKDSKAPSFLALFNTITYMIIYAVVFRIRH